MPKGFDAAKLLYQVVNGAASDSVMSDCVNVTLLAGAKWNRPLTISLVEEKPVTVTVMPPGVCWNVTLLMKGTPAALTMVLGAGPVRATPPAVRLVVSGDCSGGGAGQDGDAGGSGECRTGAAGGDGEVDHAAAGAELNHLIVDARWTGVTEGAKVRYRSAPLIATGYGAVSARVTGICWLNPEPGPVNVTLTVGVGGRFAIRVSPWLEDGAGGIRDADGEVAGFPGERAQFR